MTPKNWAGYVKEQIRFRLTVCTSCRPRCRLIRVCVTCAAQFPHPRARVGATLADRRGLSLALDSAARRRRLRSGASSTNFDIDRRTLYFLPVIFCFIDGHSIAIFGLTLSSIQTLAFNICSDFSRWSSKDELRKTNIITNTKYIRGTYTKVSSCVSAKV